MTPANCKAAPRPKTVPAVRASAEKTAPALEAVTNRPAPTLPGMAAIVDRLGSLNAASFRAQSLCEGAAALVDKAQAQAADFPQAVSSSNYRLAKVAADLARESGAFLDSLADHIDNLGRLGRPAVPADIHAVHDIAIAAVGRLETAVCVLDAHPERDNILGMLQSLDVAREAEDLAYNILVEIGEQVSAMNTIEEAA